jgi:hypothetical protein
MRPPRGDAAAGFSNRIYAQGPKQLLDSSHQGFSKMEDTRLFDPQDPGIKVEPSVMSKAVAELIPRVFEGQTEWRM